MSPWSTGKDRIEDFIAARKLTRLVGADAGVAGHMSRARQQLKSATLLLVVCRRLVLLGRGVEVAEPDTGVFGGELPVDLTLIGVGGVLPGSEFGV